jgi:DMSO reductase anchor subunit
MHPALSVIFFTTLSGAGYGLLCWAALGALGGGAAPRTLLVATLLALAMATAGLLASFWHLGKPMRAWRAFSQWRTSWLSREGVAAVLTYVPALLFAVPGTRGTAVALALTACALATVACTAMIYASLKPIPAWSHKLVLPGYVGFALLCGALPMAALGALKLHYWRSIDDAALPAARGDAVGLPGREVSVFERPNTEANYITREMAFVVARAHAERLRGLALVLFAVVPILCVLAIGRVPGVAPAAWLWAASIAALAGAFVERWLFFAQARHVVTLYY